MFSFSIRRLIGAAAVVGLAASAVVVGSVAVPAQTLALPGAAESSVVTIEPTRIADSRSDIGLVGRVVADEARQFTVTGLVGAYDNRNTPTGNSRTTPTSLRQVVPAGATGVFLNVTVITPSAPGFLAIRPGTATGLPKTAGLNFDTGTVLANGVLIALPTTGDNAGQIDLYYGAIRGASMHVIIDVAGYTTSSGLIDLAKRVEKLESPGVAAATISTGEQGEQGEQGPAGFNGATGAPGIQGERGVGDLGCNTDQTISWDDAEGSWMCANPVANTDTLASLNCTINQTIGWNGEAWECRSAPITASLTRNPFSPPGYGIEGVFTAYSPNVDTSYGICVGWRHCEIHLVDVVDHTSCQVNVSDPAVDFVLSSDHIDLWFIVHANPGQTLYVNISCSPGGAPMAT